MATHTPTLTTIFAMSSLSQNGLSPPSSGALETLLGGEVGSAIQLPEVSAIHLPEQKSSTFIANKPGGAPAKYSDSMRVACFIVVSHDASANAEPSRSHTPM